MPLKPPSTSVSRLPDKSRFCSDVCAAPRNVPWSMDDRRLALISRLTRLDQPLNDPVAIVAMRLRLKLAVVRSWTPDCGSESGSSSCRRLPLRSSDVALAGSLNGAEVSWTSAHVTLTPRRPSASLEDTEAHEQTAGHVASQPVDRHNNVMITVCSV